MWEKFERLLTRLETKGFQSANTAHKWTVNVLFMGFSYGVYTMFRDYNQFFIDARVKKKEKVKFIN